MDAHAEGPAVPAVQLLWAKTSRDGTRTHPLICHMIDVAAVTQALWDGAFPAGLHRRFCQALDIGPNTARTWLAFAAGLHDLGKACPAFQEKHVPSRDALLAAGFRFEGRPVVIRAPHGTVTAYSATWLLRTKFGMDPRVAARLGRAVGGHHGLFPTDPELLELGPARRGGREWDAVRGELFDTLAAVLGVENPLPWPPALAGDQSFWALLAGLTSVADWLGSIEDRFFDLVAPTLVDYASLAYTQALRALEDLGWAGWAPPAQPAPFRDLFAGYEPRPLQQAAIDCASRLASPALVIIEAPMGEGKTEAALYLGDHRLAAEQQRGLYVAMPTQATSNQMLGRVQRFLQDRYRGGRVDLHLLHGGAAWSDDMDALRLAAIDQSGESTVVAHSWFLPRKRGLLAPFAVGTVDQALLSVLQTKHFFVRLFGLAHKTVIFDEVHAYDTYMSELLQHLLRWLSAMGCTVVLLSATLPASTRRRLVEAFTGRAAAQAAAYPALTWAAAGSEGVIPLQTSPAGARAVSVEWIDREPAAVVSALAGALQAGGCAAVICNTVGRAQSLYQALAESRLTEPGDLILFHARFPAGRRAQIEDRVVSTFGKGGSRPTRGRRSIVVATQVIEQSLDLDFDLMVSDLAPVDLVLQRVGRLHRHAGASRPASLSSPRLLLASPALRDGLPAWGSDAYVYEPYVLLRSWLALSAPGASPLLVPGDVQALVEAVYGDLPAPVAPGSPIAAELERSYQGMLCRMEADAYQARTALVPGPCDEDLLSALSRQLDEDNPELHEAWRALTRLAPPNVTLVCLHVSPSGVALEPGGPPLRLGKPPGRDLTAELARRTVSLSNPAVVRHFLAQEPPSGWEDHPMLRYCRAALFENGRCDAGTFWLRLDDRLGLVMQRKEGK